MAAITSDCDAMRSPPHQMALITSDCAQHFEESLPLHMTPVEHLQEKFELSMQVRPGQGGFMWLHVASSLCMAVALLLRPLGWRWRCCCVCWSHCRSLSVCG